MIIERGDIVKISTNKQLDGLIKTGRKVIVKFYADWCVPCKRLAPHYKQAADKMFGHIWTEVNAEEAPELVERFGVSGVPAVFAVEGDTITPVEGRTVVQLVKEVA